MTTENNTQLSKLEALMPAFNMESDKKRAYFAYRMSGFSRLESRTRCSIAIGTYRLWMRTDKSFAEFDSQSLQVLSKQYRKESLGLDFTRVLKLAMVVDERVFDKAARDDKLTSEEWDYLKKIRPLYTPAALKIMEDLIKDVDSKGLESWDDVMIVLRRNVNAQGRNEEISSSNFIELQASGSYEESS